MTLFNLKKSKVVPYNKYKASRVKHHAGYSFSSKLESVVFDMLLLMEKAKELKDIRVQKHVKLTAAQILYVVDFEAFDLKQNKMIYFEAKGYETPEWKIKKRLWKHYGPGPLYIYRGHYQSPKLDEHIIPEQGVE